MAQAVRHAEVELESLLSQANVKGLLLQKEANGQQIPGTYVPAGQLKYDEPEGWTITQLYAVLIGSHKLGVHGEYPTQKLEKLFYEVSFEVMLANNCNINEVELKRTLPDGSVVKEIKNLTKYPKNERISLKVGEKFFNWFESGNVEFELNGTECKTLKKGLVVFGVLIKQVVNP